MKNKKLKHIHNQCVFLSINPEKRPFYEIVGYTDQEETNLWISMLQVKLSDLLFRNLIVQTDLLLSEEVRILSVLQYNSEIQVIEWDINILQEKISRQS